MLCNGTRKSESELESESERESDEKETGLESGMEMDLESESEMGLGLKMRMGLRSELGLVSGSVGSAGSAIRISSSLSVSRAMTQSSDSVVRDVRDVVDDLGDGATDGPEGSLVFVALAPFLKTLTVFLEVSVAFLVASRVVGAMVVVFKKKSGSHRGVTTLKSQNRRDNAVGIREKQKREQDDVLRCPSCPLNSCAVFLCVDLNLLLI